MLGVLYFVRPDGDGDTPRRDSMNAPRGIAFRFLSSAAKPSGENVIVTIGRPRFALGVVGVPERPTIVSTIAFG